LAGAAEVNDHSGEAQEPRTKSIKIHRVCPGLNFMWPRYSGLARRGSTNFSRDDSFQPRMDTDEIRITKSEARKRSACRSPDALCQLLGHSHGQSWMNTWGLAVSGDAGMDKAIPLDETAGDQSRTNRFLPYCGKPFFHPAPSLFFDICSAGPRLNKVWREGASNKAWCWS